MIRVTFLIYEVLFNKNTNFSHKILVVERTHVVVHLKAVEVHYDGYKL